MIDVGVCQVDSGGLWYTLKEETCECNNNVDCYKAERPSGCQKAACCRHVYK